jgi:hypothetical protein
MTIPGYADDVGRGLVAKILKDAGFALDDFLRLR